MDGPGQPTPASLVRIRREEGSLAPNTARSYAHDLREFNAWAQVHGHKGLPALPTTIDEYVEQWISGHDGHRQPAPSTIARSLAAIDYEHKRSGYQSPTHFARRTLDRYREAMTHAAPPRKRKIPRQYEVDGIWGRIKHPTLRGKRDRLIVSLLQVARVKTQDLIGLDVGDATFTENSLILTIKDHTGTPARRLHITRDEYDARDPAPFLRDWLAALHQASVIEGPLLRAIDRHGRLAGTEGAAVRGTGRMSANGISKILNGLAGHALSGWGLSKHHSFVSTRAVRIRTEILRYPKNPAPSPE
ncbi:hypothetical protein Rhe02_34480 [Rhizocola hellebori]|uniref:Integrase SAM-like N-terminal domain-containing protein n=1 Tax=Rhizocola hellebori TaxID=1392758 RepID=A0A8J3VGV2_9ACTN|nr:site-specific integrase [Rhizocola hellebori]GIH05381.1 hypothetical protein Rhe02_34480 [Rhizocola hellebori]